MPVNVPVWLCCGAGVRPVHLPPYRYPHPSCLNRRLSTSPRATPSRATNNQTTWSTGRRPLAGWGEGAGPHTRQGYIALMSPVSRTVRPAASTRTNVVLPRNMGRILAFLKKLVLICFIQTSSMFERLWARPAVLSRHSYREQRLDTNNNQTTKIVAVVHIMAQPLLASLPIQSSARSWWG